MVNKKSNTYINLLTFIVINIIVQPLQLLYIKDKFNTLECIYFIFISFYLIAIITNFIINSIFKYIFVTHFGGTNIKNLRCKRIEVSRIILHICTILLWGIGLLSGENVSSIALILSLWCWDSIGSSSLILYNKSICINANIINIQEIKEYKVINPNARTEVNFEIKLMDGTARIYRMSIHKINMITDYIRNVRNENNLLYVDDNKVN